MSIDVTVQFDGDLRWRLLLPEYLSETREVDYGRGKTILMYGEYLPHSYVRCMKPGGGGSLH
jgi:hypothetical protein